ncbi:MAG: amidohydrolase family protein [Myxococcales bacterium]|nr:amidohydrolase family protein [Myxococcales bacterium]
MHVRLSTAAISLCLAGCATTRYSGPIIDFHVHLEAEGEAGRINPKQPATEAALSPQMDTARVGKAGVITIALRGNAERTRRQNDFVRALAEAKPERFFAIGSVHPEDGLEARRELERLAQAGVKVVKLHPNTQRFDVDSPAVAEVVERAAELKMVVLFDGWSPFDADQTGKLMKLAITKPHARLVIAHMGGARFDEMMAFHALELYPWYARNVWFDLSAVTRFYADSPYREQLLFVCRKVGVDRLLFGSDFPMVQPSQAVADVEKMGFTPEELRRIFHDNAAELLGRSR